MVQTLDGMTTAGPGLRRAGLIGVLMLLLSISAAAQSGTTQQRQSMKLSLEKALELAHDQNFDLRDVRTDERIARAEYRKSNAVFLPQISVEESAVSTNDPLNVFGFKLKQEIVQQADFDPALLNDPDAIDNYTTKIQVQQPVFNLDGFMGRNALKNRYKAAEAKSERTKYYTVFQVKKTYYQLVLAQRRVQVIDSALTVARANRKQAHDFFEQGMINKADFLAADVRVKELETQQTQAANGAETQADQLRYMLDLSDDVKLIPTDGLEYQSVPSVAYNFGQINEQRSDMRALKYQLNASRSNLNAMRFRFLPSLNIFGSYEWNDQNLFGTRAENYMIGASLKWNLFSGYKNVGSVEQASAQLSKMKLAYEQRSFRNRIDIMQAERAIEQAQRQIELTRSAMQQAEEHLRIRRNRYEKGMEKTTDVLMAETQLSEARLNHLQALFQLNVSTAQLELLLEKDISR